MPREVKFSDCRSNQYRKPRLTKGQGGAEELGQAFVSDYIAKKTMNLDRISPLLKSDAPILRL